MKSGSVTSVGNAAPPFTAVLPFTASTAANLPSPPTHEPAAVSRGWLSFPVKESTSSSASSSTGTG